MAHAGPVAPASAAPLAASGFDVFAMEERAVKKLERNSAALASVLTQLGNSAFCSSFGVYAMEEAEVRDSEELKVKKSEKNPAAARLREPVIALLVISVAAMPLRKN